MHESQAAPLLCLERFLLVEHVHSSHYDVSGRFAVQFRMRNRLADVVRCRSKGQKRVGPFILEGLIHDAEVVLEQPEVSAVTVGEVAEVVMGEGEPIPIATATVEGVEAAVDAVDDEPAAKRAKMCARPPHSVPPHLLPLPSLRISPFRRPSLDTLLTDRAAAYRRDE